MGFKSPTFILILVFIYVEKAQARCPFNYVQNKEACYHLSEALLSWDEADSYCRTHSDGRLASLRHFQAAIESKLFDVSRGNLWVSTPTKPENKEKKLGDLNDNSDFEDENHCTSLTVELTAVQDICSRKKQFMCVASYDDTDDACDTDRGFEQKGGNCFVYVENKMNWNEADVYCWNTWDSRLASVVSEEEHIYLSDVGRQYQNDLWIGLSDQISPGNLEWSNGYDQLVFTRWDDNQPNITSRGSSCVKTELDSGGLWQVSRCSEEKPFLCKKGLKQTCPSGWTYHNGKCYNFYLNENLFLTWSDARDFCHVMNAELVKIETPDEHDFLKSFYSQWKELDILQVWIGLSDVVVDDTFRWSDGSALSSYALWDVDPEIARRQGINDCVWIYAGKETNNWEIGNCFLLQPYICQIPEGVALSPIPRPTINYTCADGWRLHKESCYYFAYEELPWEDAEAYCRSSERGGGHLVSIHNEDEQSFISGHIKEQSWSGMTRAANNLLIWSDGTPLDFFNWKKNQPNNDGQCIRVIGVDSDNAWGQWNDQPCTNLDHPICKTEADNTSPDPLPTLPPDDVCKDGYFHNSILRRCYKIVSSYKRTWNDARLHCQQEGADLLAINSPEEQDFINLHTSLLSEALHWIGGIDVYNGPVLRPDNSYDGGWAWIDGTPFNFVNWNAGEPNNVGEEDCIIFRSADGLWNDLHCDQLQAYICEKSDGLNEDSPADCTSADCCFRHLGVELGGKISDDQLSASSQLDEASGANRGRLNMPDQYVDALGVGGLGRGGWIAAGSDKAPWFKVDFRGWKEIRGIVTQGRNGFSQPNNQNDWVRKYTVQYMVNPISGVFEDYKEADTSVKVFDANYDQDHQITNIFTRPIVTTAIKILPVDCRKKCAMRIEVLGCEPTCSKSLGISNNPLNPEFPIIPNNQMSASSEQLGYEAYNGRLDYSGGDEDSVLHFLMDDASITYDSAREACYKNGRDLCLQSDICPNGIPIIIGVLKGDRWAPIRDGYNDWVQIGDDNGNAGRICWKHNDHYAAPNWGITPGDCPPWNLESTCDLKENIFCCAANDKCWKPAKNSVSEWLQVDFGEYKKIAGVSVQGYMLADDWITSYYLSFSNDGSVFRRYKTPSGQDELFPGCTDRDTPVEGFLREPITARYLRIEPQSWNNNIALRMDVIGCDVTTRSDCTDQANAYAQDVFTIDCPSGCGDISGNLWGTGIYTDDSFICSAAIHDGRIIANNGGTVEVTKIDGQDSYQGSVQHGVTSLSKSSTEGAFMFQGNHLGCPIGWDGWNEWCYYMTTRSSNLNHAQARERCLSYGGDLVSIHSQAEQDFVTSLLFKNFGSIRDLWIGMTDFDHVNYFQWEDGTDVTYTKWDFNEPNGGENERCVQMFKVSGYWNDQSCDDEFNYMCKMDKIPVNQDQEAVDGCNAGWLAWESSCYLFDRTADVYINAEDFCSDLGGYLVSIGNYYEQMFVTAQASQSAHQDDIENFYIGLAGHLQPDGSIVYEWSSGEPVTFTAWGKDEPDVRHQCSFPFLYENVEYYECINFGPPAKLLGAWCSADPVYSNHPVSCEGAWDGLVGCMVIDKTTGLWLQANPLGCISLEYRICEAPRKGFTTEVSSTPSHPSGDCPTGWYGTPNSVFCYQVNEKQTTQERMSWDLAKSNCESQGANLASIHSTDEEIAISNAVQGFGDYEFWIGLRRQSDGFYSWTDQTPLTYTNWGDNEPNNHNGRENCVEARFYPEEYSWNDINCDAARNWICKIQRGLEVKPPATTPTPTFSPGICGSDVDWVAHTSPATGVQKCYHFGSSPLQTWRSSNDYCNVLGGSLVSIGNSEEQEFISSRSYLSGVDRLWIGLIQDTMNGPYLWIDETPLTFVNWMGGGQPDNNNGHEMCVNLAANTGLWSDSNCGLQEGFICQKYPGSPPGSPTPTPSLQGGCPVGWIPYGSKCFLEVGLTDESLRDTWMNAEAYCQTQNGNLASLPNAYYNAFITSQLFGAYSNIWIGLNSLGSDQNFKWSDNEETAFVNWAASEPSFNNGEEECVEMRWETNDAGKWNDLNCDNIRPFFCSRKKNPEFPEIPSSSNICPSGFVEWDTSCYKLFTSRSNWKDSKEMCFNEGKTLGITMDLASVWNVYENSFLTTLFWPQDSSSDVYENMWIGLLYNFNETTGENMFEWSDQSPVVYTNWGLNEPQIPPKSSGCVAMNYMGTWGMSDLSGNSLDCDQSLIPFVCKYETLVLPTSDPGLGTCDAGWSAFGDYCYKVQPGHNSLDGRSWGDANWECVQRGGNLASIHSDIENKAFLSWTDHKNVWIGLSRNGYGGWSWVDESPVEFTNWNDGEPNDFGESGEACTELTANGKWNDNSCQESKGYICKKHKVYSSCAVPSNQRVDCGNSQISEYDCLARGCCWDVEGLGPHLCYFSDADSPCTSKGGLCRDYRYVECELGYETLLCEGENERRCCFECQADDEVCNENVEDWEEGDAGCEENGYGHCQYASNYCASDVYESLLCGGPNERRCCVANPLTLPPETISTSTQNKPPSTDGKVTTTRGQTSVVTTQTAGPTIENVAPTGNGLDGGAIAGIVLALVFVVAGLSVALYCAKSKSLLAKSQPSDVVGFSNPIVYNKEDEEEAHDDV